MNGEADRACGRDELCRARSRQRAEQVRRPDGRCRSAQPRAASESRERAAVAPLSLSSPKPSPTPPPSVPWRWLDELCPFPLHRTRQPHHGGSPMSVVVLGSANLDLVYEVERIPTPGETVLSHGCASFPGGKGNNQAIAAARAGADVQFIVALGRDDAGDRARRRRPRRRDHPPRPPRRRPHRHRRHLRGPQGRELDRRELRRQRRTHRPQRRRTRRHRSRRRARPPAREPLVTVEAAMRAARAASTTVVLNAAPSAAVPPHLLAEVDILVVNQHEAAELAGEPAGTGERSLLSVLTAHTCDVIITLGAEGALVGSRGTTPVRIPAFRVEAKDTTGAGDAFVGAFAASLDHTATNAPSWRRPNSRPPPPRSPSSAGPGPAPCPPEARSQRHRQTYTFDPLVPRPLDRPTVRRPLSRRPREGEREDLRRTRGPGRPAGVARELPHGARTRGAASATTTPPTNSRDGLGRPRHASPKSGSGTSGCTPSTGSGSPRSLPRPTPTRAGSTASSSGTPTR